MNFRRHSFAWLLFAGVVIMPALALSDDSSSPIPANVPQSNTKTPPAPKSIDAGTAAPAEAINPPSVTVIEPVNAQGILGHAVHSSNDEDMGRIADVVVDLNGQVRAAVIDFGGFLGVGSRRIVVDWNALHFGKVAKKGESITLELSRDQVKAAPEYKEGAPIIVLGSSGSLEPLRFPPSQAEH